MTPERWARIKAIFADATAREPAQRAAWLAEACGDDAALRAEVDKLLAAHERTGAVFDKPAAAYVTGEALTAGTHQWLGQRLGPWEISAILGRGGMGEVYRARRVDAEYDKEAAIKLVPAGYQAEFVLKRLRTERQILATLEHPNIARLIDGGASEQGVPYLVMELVDGVPIDEYCRGKPLETMLRLFRDVCAAVTYAHQRLVVHRDLKPSNILVTADGAVKLLDFGIAKLLQPSNAETGAPEATRFQTFTPGFASPEQVLGQPITTASDVYSLGVLLYLLLAGRGPYRRIDSTQDAIREVCETEPAAPSSVAPRVARDLDAICLRALRKEPDRRYRSVEEFSEDIRRYLSGLPVIARGDQFSYRAGKFLRRHRIEVAAAVLLVISLAGGLAFTLREARVAEAQRARAERHFASVRELADVFMFDIHDAIKDLPGSTDARQLLVKNSLRYLNTLAAEAGDDVEMRKELAAAYEKVADIQGQAYGNANTGQQREALTSYAQAIALLEPVVASHPGDTVVRTSLARNYLRQSRLLLLVGDSKDAVAASGRAVAAFEALASEHPDKDAQLRVAEAYSAHAYTMDMGAGQDDVGIAFAKKSAGILEELTRQHPDDQAIAYKLATAYGTLAVTVLGEKPDRATLEESLSFHRKALAVDEKLVTATSGGNARYSRALLQDRYNIAFVLYELGDYQGAVESGRAGEPILAKMLADANNTQARVEGANLAWPLGRSLLALGQIDEAAAIFERHVKVLDDLARDSDTLKVQYLLGCMSFGLGDAYARRKEWRSAQEWYGKAVPHFERVTQEVKLDHMDQRPVDEAIAGLARAKAELNRVAAG